VFSNYFLTQPISPDQLIGHYDIKLVALSYIVAVFASYIALDFTARLRDSGMTPLVSYLWVAGGAIAMGAGIWSMHFIGMLSFSLPGLSLQYDLFWTGISLLVAIVASAFALYLLRSSKAHLLYLINGGLILGIAIAAMHYTGMQAMKDNVNIQYLPDLFTVSIIVAIVASEAAIYLAIKSNQVMLRMRNQLKIVGALIMGLGICGMHYTGMMAAVCTPLCVPVSHSNSLDTGILAMCVSSITFVILGMAFFASSYKEAANQKNIDSARQSGMAEVAASVLHNVGNVLNSVNVSVNLIGEELSTSKLHGLKKLALLFAKHKEDLGGFLSQNDQAIKTVHFIGKLSDHLDSEQRRINEEVVALKKNINHINAVISTQQNLSKITGVQQVALLSEIIDEALLITGIGINKNYIMIEKKYGKIKPIVVDKVKLLQVLVNVIQNAKEALMDSSNQVKVLTAIISEPDQNKIIIQISDNGVGILSKNIDKIFVFGFTTKNQGHGFGLHSSALSMREMGGDIQVQSKGTGKGTTFIIKLPYILPR
jgi:NO-binding membrane sensor protein with MHYT domain/signal transduction histidine kinase